VAFLLLDRACYGSGHAAGRPIIGTRANIQRLRRADLLAYAQAQYTACNVVVAAAGPVDAEAFTRLVEQAFTAMPTGQPNGLSAPRWQGGLKTRSMAGSGQCQVLLGFEAPSLGDAESTAHLPHVLAAALLGEGMSSPLLDEIRERRGLGPADTTPMGREGSPQRAKLGVARRPHSRAGQRCNDAWPAEASLPAGLWPERPQAALQILAG